MLCCSRNYEQTAIMQSMATKQSTRTFIGSWAQSALNFYITIIPLNFKSSIAYKAMYTVHSKMCTVHYSSNRSWVILRKLLDSLSVFLLIYSDKRQRAYNKYHSAACSNLA